LLRTIPPTFSPFYKREVDTYFRKYQAKNWSYAPFVGLG
jgi:hypothetical protein